MGAREHGPQSPVRELRGQSEGKDPRPGLLLWEGWAELRKAKARAPTHRCLGRAVCLVSRILCSGLRSTRVHTREGASGTGREQRCPGRWPGPPRRRVHPSRAPPFLRGWGEPPSSCEGRAACQQGGPRPQARWVPALTGQGWRGCQRPGVPPAMLTPPPPGAPEAAPGPQAQGRERLSKTPLVCRTGHPLW